MLDSKNILSLLSIPVEDVSSFSIISDSQDISIIEIELIDTRPNCPYCHSNKIFIKDYYNKNVKNNVIIHHKIYVKIRMRRYKCSKCNATFKQPFYLVEENNQISFRTKELVREMLLSRVSMEYISKELGISKQTVLNILDEMPDPLRLSFPQSICIDEFYFSNANTKAGKYPSVISNPFNADIVDIIESRKKDYLIDYFNKIPLSELNNVKYFISDMNETYRSIFKIFFKNAIHIVDHFHIIQLFTKAIQSVRIKIIKTLNEKDKVCIFLKKNWKLFLKNRWDLKKVMCTNKKTGVTYCILDKIDNILKQFPSLHEIYWAKDEFSSYMLKLHERDDTENMMNFFIKKYSSSTVVELNNIASTFSNWKKEIINAYAKNSTDLVLTNAMAESNNNYIQTLINIAYGYTNFKRLRKRILYMSSNRKKDD